MIAQSQEYLEKLFIADVDELSRLGQQKPRTNTIRLRISGLLRKLVADEQPLALQVERGSRLPLLILVAEPIAGNPRYDPHTSIPDEILKYIPEITDQTHPGGKQGYFYCPYPLDQYMRKCHMVLFGRTISPREVIKFLANKMGGIHAEKNLKDISDGGRSVDAETLYQANERMSE